MSNPRLRVQGPGYLPAPFGLLTAAQVIDNADAHFRNGVEWEPLCAPAATATLSPCYPVLDPEGDPEDRIDADPPAKTASDAGGAVGLTDGEAVTLYAVHTCARVGRDTQADQDRAGMLLTNGEVRALEAVLLNGETEAGTLPRSLDALATEVTDAASSIAYAVALIEDALYAADGGVGIVYMPRSLALLGLVDEVLRIDGQRLLTRLGTPVAAGTGFGAPAADDASATIYGSGPLAVHRGGVEFLDGFDRAVNRHTVIAERDYALTWGECAVVSATVDLAIYQPGA